MFPQGTFKVPHLEKYTYSLSGGELDERIDTTLFVKYNATGLTLNLTQMN